MFERFTDRARRTIAIAQDEARTFSHNRLGTEHILLGLVVEHGGAAGRALADLGLDAATVRSDIGEIIGTVRGANDAEVLRTIGIDLDEVISAASEAFGSERVSKAMAGARTGGAALTPGANKVMEFAPREAKALGHNFIGTEHLLLAIVRVGEGVAAQILVKRTPGLATVRDTVVATCQACRQSGT